MLNVLHVIKLLTTGGSPRALMGVVKYSPLFHDINHSILTLLPTDLDSIEWIKDVDFTLLQPSDHSANLDLLAKADIVHVHFWNDPRLHEFLALDLPPMRLVVWIHVTGEPPQSIPPELIEYGDITVAGSPYAYENPVFQNLSADIKSSKTRMINAGSDWSRLAELKPRAHSGFNVGYFGQVTSGKIHPNYVSMSEAINIPDVKFILCGRATGKNILKSQAEDLGIGHKFDFRGHVEDIKSVIEVLDVYGYPLSPHTSAGSELSLQEVMYAGVPPVVFPHANIKRIVKHGQTGLVVHSEAEYSQAIEYLYHHPEERQRLGNNASQYARETFGAESTSRSFVNLYNEIMERPKRYHRLRPREHVELAGKEPLTESTLLGSELSGSEWFIYALGDTVPQFSISRNSSDLEEILNSEREIKDLPSIFYTMVGGVVSYLNYYPDDAYLHLWHGLLLQCQDKISQAIDAFQEARRLGLPTWRLDTYLAECSELLTL